MSNTIAVEVAYALPDKQRIIKLDVPEGTTVMQAVIMSQMDSIFEDLTLSEDLKLGVWGKAVTGDRALVAGERVEIYRPLLVDPKRCVEPVRRARRRRAVRVVGLRTPLKRLPSMEPDPSPGHPGPLHEPIRLPRTTVSVVSWRG